MVGSLQLRTAAGVVGCLVMLAGTGSASADTVGLRSIAPRPFIGTAVDASALTREADYNAAIGHEFNILTPENAMKWQPVENTRGVLNFTDGDRLVQYAEANGEKVRGHTLVWHSQLPNWLTRGTFTNQELEDILHQHITDEVSHFRGHIYAWDVVNEVISDSNGAWRDTLWYRAMGPSFVEKAFRWAHEADPAAKLYINDYSTENINAKSDALYNLVKQLKSDNVPVDGVGFQGHIGIASPFPASFQQNLQRFADLGVDVAITEADVRITTPVTPEQLASQADYFGRLARACVMVSRCASMTVWGFSDRHSWITNGAATPMDTNLQPKPAYYALQDALRQSLATQFTAAGGTVAATLGLTVGAPTAFAPFIPGVAKAYNASTTATVVSSAGDATLSVADPGTTAPGRLVNGPFTMAQPLQVTATSAAGTGTGVAPVGSAAAPLLTYSGPVSNDVVTVAFTQPIGAGDPLRTGSYSKTLTFTLSTTNP